MTSMVVASGLCLSALLAACSGVAVPDPAPGPSAPEWRPPSGPVTAYQRLNPTDEQDRTIFLSADGTCYVPAAAADRSGPPVPEPVPCPGPMRTDPAWAACADGVLLVEGVDPLTCVCTPLHDPQPRASPCAAEALTRRGAKTR